MQIETTGVPLHPTRDARIEMTTRWGAENQALTRPWGSEARQLLWEEVWQFVTPSRSYWNYTPRHVPKRNGNIRPRKTLYANVHSSITHNCPKGRQPEWCLHKGVLLGNKQK